VQTLKHEAFVQAYVSRAMNGTKAYRAVYPSIKSDDVAGLESEGRAIASDWPSNRRLRKDSLAQPTVR
jgi:hypothetical protein